MGAHLVFCEQPGCISNRRQGLLLRASGYVLEVRNPLAALWTPGSRHPYPVALSVPDGFTPSTLPVMRGETDRARLTARALARLCTDPMLIRRPLMASGGRFRAGCDPAAVDVWIGLADPGSPGTDLRPRPHRTVSGS